MRPSADARAFGHWSSAMVAPPSLRGCLPPVAAQAGGGGKISCSAEREQAPPCPVCDAGRWSCHRRFVHTPTPPQPSPARDTFPSAGLSSSSVCRQGGTHSGTAPTGRGSRGGSRGNRGAGLVFDKSGMAPPATLSLTRAPRRPHDGRAAACGRTRPKLHATAFDLDQHTRLCSHTLNNELTPPMSAS